MKQTASENKAVMNPFIQKLELQSVGTKEPVRDWKQGSGSLSLATLSVA